jgi:hypothetical protein
MPQHRKSPNSTSGPPRRLPTLTTVAPPGGTKMRPSVSPNSAAKLGRALIPARRESQLRRSDPLRSRTRCPDAMLAGDRSNSQHDQLRPDWLAFGQSIARHEKQGMGISLASSSGRNIGWAQPRLVATSSGRNLEWAQHRCARWFGVIAMLSQHSPSSIRGRPRVPDAISNGTHWASPSDEPCPTDEPAQQMNPPETISKFSSLSAQRMRLTVRAVLKEACKTAL